MNTPYDYFLEKIQNFQSESFEGSDIQQMYRCLINMVGRKAFDEAIMANDDDDLDERFYAFHKMIRQASVAEDIYRIDETCKDEVLINKRWMKADKLDGWVDSLLHSLIGIDNEAMFYKVFLEYFTPEKKPKLDKENKSDNTLDI